MFEFINNHQQLVNDLLAGKFITREEAVFGELSGDTLEYYKEFFNLTFGCELIKSDSYMYLQSSESNETLSSQIMVFLGVLLYELDRTGKNIQQQTEFHSFKKEDVEALFEASSYKKLVTEIPKLSSKDKEVDISGMLTVLSKLNIISKDSEEYFTFTSAVNYFFDYARELFKERENTDTTNKEEHSQ